MTAPFNPSPPDNTYRATPVHFDGLTYLLNEAVKATDTNYANYSVWVKVTRVALNPFATPWALIFDDPPTANLSTPYFGDDTANFELAENFYNAARDKGSFSTSADESVFFSYDTWHHILVASDNSTGTPVIKTYVDNVDIGTTAAQVGAPFVVAFNTFAMTVGTDLLNDGGDYTGDMADLWIGNQNLLVAGDIPEATRRLFISPDGRPVTPDHFPSALILLTGDKDNFSTNRGSGGSFAVTGTLTNSTTSPSDVPAPGYEAYAVHFDGATALKNNALVATDNGTVSMSGWFKLDVTANDFPSWWACDPEGSYPSYSDFYTSGGGTSFGASFALSNLPTSPSGVIGIDYGVSDDPAPILSGVWFHVLVSMDATESLAKGRLYINDVAIDVPTAQGGAVPLVGIFNNLPFWLGLDGVANDALICDAADWWIAPGVSLLDADDNIPEGVRRRFITADGKPADPVNWPSAAVMMYGNAAMFSTNRGTGGSFVVDGSLTDATTSPSQPYPAPAVNFDGATGLKTATTLTATDNGSVSMSGWFKFDATPNNNAPTIWVADPEGGYLSYNDLTSDGTDYGFSTVVVLDAGATALLLANYNLPQVPGVLVPDVWHHFLYTMDTNSTPKKYKLYVDDAAVTTVDTDVGIAFDGAFNGLPFWIGLDGAVNDELFGDAADLRIMPGVSLLDANGDIPEATRRLFIDADGKPVNPITATATLGVPVMLFSGDATIFGTDRGTGGAFTTTGVLTNATTSPSD